MTERRARSGGIVYSRSLTSFTEHYISYQHDKHPRTHCGVIYIIVIIIVIIIIIIMANWQLDLFWLTVK